jgi:hypothetical protein
MTVLTYTRQQALFLTDGLGVNCALARIHRAEVLENRNQLFAFTPGDGALTILEFEPAGRRGRRARPERLVHQLVTIRDVERAKLPAEKRESLERIDLELQRYGLSELWASQVKHPMAGH